MAQLFNMTTEQVINYEGGLPTEAIIKDKTAVEQMRFIKQLEEEAKQTTLNLKLKVKIN